MNSAVTAGASPASESTRRVDLSASALVRAELGRAARTRSTVVLLLIAVVATLAIFSLRAFVFGGLDDAASDALIVVSADVVGFIVLCSTALAVARDHQTGASELVRVLVPARARRLLAVAGAHALLATAAVIAVTAIGAITTLVVAPSSFSPGGLAEGSLRLIVITVSLAYAGAGIGSLCRSSAATTFVVLTLYLLAPIALLVTGFAGQAWAGELADVTLGLLGSTAISDASDAWLAVVGVIVWATVLTVLGTVREAKVR